MSHQQPYSMRADSSGECRGGEPVHGVAADAQHRARLLGAEYRVDRCDEPHLAPASALGHGRPRAPLVSRLPRVPGRGRLPGRSPPSSPAAPRLDVGVHRRPRNQELPSEPVRVDLSRPDEVICLTPARPPCTPASRSPSSTRRGPGCPRARRIS